MLLIIFLSVLLAMSASSTKLDDKNIEMEVSCGLGKIRGSIMRSRLGKNIFAFRGIRYAESPTGDLRFKPPVPVNPWSEVFDATEEGPMCPQPQDPESKQPMSEDCLRLNIYTTKLPKPNDNSTRPVLVFFHPGGYYVFSGQSSMFGPQYLMDEDIVLVTVNYRLASLGFISTGDAYAPGNLGLKDQVEALRFVQKNIGKFGGDPNAVTISGYSAGSWSVVLHMVSPMSRGLFHRAIAMSGSLTFQNLLPNHQKHLAVKQAQFVGCSTESSEEIIKCLKTKSAQEIADTLPKFGEWHGDPVAVWIPVIEPEVPGVERFLTGQPVDLIRQGKFCKVPLITGVTKDEFGGVVVRPIENARKGDTSIFDDYTANWTKIAPISFVYERDTPRSLNISETFRQFYLHGQPVSLSNVDGISHLYADSLIGFGVHRLAKLMSQYSDQPVFYYKFTYQGRYSFATWSDKKPFGVCHHDDLQYLFYMSILFPYFDADAPEIATVKRMTSMWANFVRTGKPIPEDKPEFANVTWTPRTPENEAYLEIGENLVMKKGLCSERMNVWESLFPLAPLS